MVMQFSTLLTASFSSPASIFILDSIEHPTPHHAHQILIFFFYLPSTSSTLTASAAPHPIVRVKLPSPLPRFYWGLYLNGFKIPFSQWSFLARISNVYLSSLAVTDWKAFCALQPIVANSQPASQPCLTSPAVSPLAYYPPPPFNPARRGFWDL